MEQLAIIVERKAIGRANAKRPEPIAETRASRIGRRRPLQSEHLRPSWPTEKLSSGARSVCVGPLLTTLRRTPAGVRTTGLKPTWDSLTRELGTTLTMPRLGMLTSTIPSVSKISGIGLVLTSSFSSSVCYFTSFLFSWTSSSPSFSPSALPCGTKAGAFSPPFFG